MTTKAAPTKRTNKAKAKARASARVKPTATAPKPFTEDDVRNAVERSRDLLRYRYSSSTVENVIMAWATLREMNNHRPDFIAMYPTLSWDFVETHPDMMMVTALSAGLFESSVMNMSEPFLEWIGCVQRVDDVKALHKIWSPLNVAVGFDVLGEAVMALRHG